MVTLLTALSVGVIMVIPVSGGLCYGYTKCALLPYKGQLIKAGIEMEMKRNEIGRSSQ